MCKSSLHRECLHCGTTFEVNKYQHSKKFCSDKCCYTHNNNRRSDDPDFKVKSQERWFKKTYGITLEERDAMYASQDGCCAVCGTHMSLERHKPNSAHVDHCHSSGEVLSLLCTSCNTGLGHFGENPVILAKAIQYLTETGKVPTR